ncbi:DUF4132 domain-containing protein [Brachyspira pilosicoli]|uniref:DUF4132 domain-containing protein n=1 Tax=Brachyspira pilosicoli TaxID=52584 RepID=A0AAJ6G805_BRAPL|nr:DUF4132 domain-containing protein [Brachyspira pilosicoli]WIH90306.1 DUF4132 domain-containing protein [Brachyspira pilosicoli]WIH92597.1 DUF4132 domain-containing protein [Brachyspira pilosicoli]WIH94887.1 DUF4132 domain-containing protein [Brachyspira pilosicoli]
MDLEKKLAIYYQGSAIEDDMVKCEATNDFSKIRRNSYDYFHYKEEFLKDYFSIEDEKLKKRYEHFMKILIYERDKEGEGGTRYVIFDYIVNRDFEKSLRYLVYGYEKKYKENVRTLYGQGSIYKVFEDFNKYFSKEFQEYTDKYVDIINNNDNKKILKKMDRDAVIPLIAICSVIKSNKECDEKYINAAIKSFDVLPNLYDTLNVIAALLDKNEDIKNKFIEVLNKNEEYIIDMNIILGYHLRSLDYNNPYKAREKFFKAINYPNDFAFIAQHFDDYSRYDFIYGARDLYLNHKEDFYKIYNFVENSLNSDRYNKNRNNDRNKRIFIILSSVLLEYNDNKIDTNNLKKAVSVLQTIVNKFTEDKFNKYAKRPTLSSTENIEEIFDKDKNKLFDELIDYYTSKKNTYNLYSSRWDSVPEVSLSTELYYLFSLFNYDIPEMKNYKKFALDIFKYLPIQLGIRRYIEVQASIGSKTLKEVIDSLLNNKELNVTLKEILLSYYFDYAGDLSNYYYDYGGKTLPTLYKELRCVDENNNVIINSVKDELLKSYFDEVLNILNDDKFIKDNIASNKNTALDILKTLYNKYNYNDYHLIYTVLENTKRVEVKRHCIKVISDNESITREYVEKMSEKARSSELKGALKNIIKNWNLKKYGDNFRSIDEALEFIDTYYNKNYEKNIKFLDDIHLTKVLYMNGKEADERIFKYIIMEYMNLVEPAKLKDCDMLAGILDTASFTDALEMLYIHWRDSNYEATKKNILIPYLIYSDDLKVDKVYPLVKEFAKSSRTVMAGFIIKCMALNGKNYALILVDGLTRKAPTAKIKEVAIETMENAAYMLDMTADELSDRIIPNFGFNQKGERVLNYGGEAKRTFTLSINNNLELTITDNEKEKIIKSLPAPNSKDDKAEADSAKKEYTTLKKEIKTLIQNQKIRLQKVLLNGRKWTYNNFKTVFVENPIMNIFALKLIWGVYDENNNLIESFRYMEDGSFNTVHEEEYTLKEDSLITLVHPLELDSNTIEKWKTQLSDYEIVQPIEQLNLKYEEITEKDIAEDRINSLNSKTIKAGVLMSLASKYDMARGETMDGGSFSEYILKDTYLNISVHISFDYMYFGMDANEDVSFGDIEFYEIDDGIETLINPLKVNKRFASSIYSIVKSIFVD